MSLFNRNERGKDERQTPEKSAPGGSRLALPGGSAGAARSGRNGGNDVANIGKSITIKGDLTGDEDIVVDGQVEGRIDLPNNELTIGAHGRVRADVHGKTVVVIGHVNGNVTATERVEIQANGVVDGDVRGPKLVVQEGAVLNGAVDMGGQKAGAAESGPKPAAVASS